MTPSKKSIPTLVILGPAGKDKHGRQRVQCRCECGTVFIAGRYEVKIGNTRSCGCYQRRRTSEASTTHGGSKRAEYRVWTNIRDRCMNPSNTGFHKYGGRGITVCASWKNSFAAFLFDMGPRPGPRYTVERKNNDGPYSPKNCCWATYSQQARNRRSSIFVSIHKKRILLIEACEKYGISYGKAHLRLYRGWSAERTFGVEQ